MTRNALIKRAVIIAGATALALGVTACGSSNKTPAPVVVVTPPPASLESMFGSQFATDYDAGNNTTPTHPVSGDINAVDPTKVPIPVHS